MMKIKVINYHRLTLLIILCFITAIIYSLIPYESAFVEKYYSRGFFLAYRSIWYLLSTLFPFALIYALTALIIGVLLYHIILDRRNAYSVIPIVLRTCGRTLEICCILYLIFYWLWGFNYKRLNPLAVYANTDPMSQDELFDELYRITDSLTHLRAQINTDVDWHKMEYTARSHYDLSMKKVLQAWSFPTPGDIIIRQLKPEGILLRWSTAGVYLPFVGEGHIDAGLHPIVKPFTAIHEIGHGYGFTGEDICNFLALLATINSDDVLVKYSGYFSYWQYLRGNAYLSDQQRFVDYYQCIDPSVLQDYREVTSYHNKYPDIFPKLRNLFYDQYLKSHGIKDGLNNYSRIIVLSHQWRQVHGNLSYHHLNATPADDTEPSSR